MLLSVRAHVLSLGASSRKSRGRGPCADPCRGGLIMFADDSAALLDFVVKQIPDVRDSASTNPRAAVLLTALLSLAQALLKNRQLRSPFVSTMGGLQQ